MHLSTAKQLSGTLNRFFADVPAVTILKCDYGRLSAWKVVKWEGPSDSSERTLSASPYLRDVDPRRLRIAFLHGPLG